MKEFGQLYEWTFGCLFRYVKRELEKQIQYIALAHARATSIGLHVLPSNLDNLDVDSV